MLATCPGKVNMPRNLFLTNKTKPRIYNLEVQGTQNLEKNMSLNLAKRALRATLLEGLCMSIL